MKFGILGYGSIGQRHAGNLKALGHEVSWHDPDRVPTVLEFREELIDDSDAVLICTPTEQHATDLRDVPRDKPVFVEKPIGRVEDIEDIRSVLKARTACTMVGCNLRFHPSIVVGKGWIGQIGKVHCATFAASQPPQRKYLDDGILLNCGAHELDLVTHLLGAAEVKACIANIGTAQVALRCGAAPVAVHLDWSPRRSREIDVSGALGFVTIDLENRTTRFELYDEDEECRNISWASTIDSDYRSEIKHFIRAIEGHSFLPGATGADGLATLELIAAAQKMAA